MNSFYPTPDELSAWIDEIWKTARETPVTVERIEDGLAAMNPYFFVGHTLWKSRFYKFSPQGRDPFYVYWQPVENGPAPLCTHLPGYGCEINSHPDTVSRGFNVLEVAPWGMVTPDGFTPKRDQVSVLPETIRSLAKDGYFYWFADCIQAVLWAWQQPETLQDRVSFYGTSQGGGTALLLASLFRDHGVRCVAADVPFLTNFKLAGNHGAYSMVAQPVQETAAQHGEAAAWKSLGYVDTICHAHRLTMPVLLTSGTTDELVPEETVNSLFEILPKSRCYMDIEGRSHGFTPEFIHLAWAWMRLYA